MTLAHLLALDAAAMWDALPRDRQLAIVVPLLLSEFASVTAQDDGTDASPQDRETAACIEHRAFDESMQAVEAAFPAILGDDLTARRDGPTADMFVDEGRVRVKGHAKPRKLLDRGRAGLFVRIAGRVVGVSGFKNLATEDAPLWEAWTAAQVDEERLRRHPDQAIGPCRPAADLPEDRAPHTDRYYADDGADEYAFAA